jgi:hypothetical protein
MLIFKILTHGSLLALTVVSANALASDYPDQLLWGDTHLHSSYSSDAYLAGNRTAGPDVAYRYAKGEPVIHPYNRTRVQIQQPLDFLAVADHAELLGVVSQVMSGEFEQPEASFFERIKSWFVIKFLENSIEEPTEATRNFTKKFPTPIIKSGDTRDPIQTAIDTNTEAGLSRIGLINSEAAARITASKWGQSMQAAEKHNAPGSFTTLVGWEWTQTASGANLHRVVVSDVKPSVAAGFNPVGAGQAPYPEMLWDALDVLSKSTKANFVSIPHNSNISKGYMFSKTTVKGEAISKEYAAKRALWEPIAEATQIKGDSETHPDLAPDDEFADFERFNFYLQAFPQAAGYKAQQGDTIRSALKSGLEFENELGINPYKLGMIGSTDAHTSIASAEEPNFWGKVSVDSIPANKRRYYEDGYADGIQSFNGWSMSASGLAAVWSPRNDRKSIIAAMQRKETYATTGPRIQLRFFAAWDFIEGDALAEDIAEIGYQKGVPMGGELSNSTVGGAPSFLIKAVKGALDHNLDRVQVIKGWTDASGEAQEKVFDVLWSGDRQPNQLGKLPSVGNSANINTGKTANTIGSAELAGVWIDPEFNPQQNAFYYARVLQIPTVRHSQLDAVSIGLDTPFEGPATIQERAYSSPIWYSPLN